MATRKETAKRKISLVQEIRREYRTGALAPGEMLPPVRTLATQYGISKRIVNDELQKLAAEGWLKTVPRVGVFVKERESSKRFLDHAVVVIADVERPASMHKQTGWTDHISYGALREVHRRGLHSVILHPARIGDEAVQRLADEQPYGAVIPEMDEMAKYGEVLRRQGVRVVMNGNEPHVCDFDRVVSDHKRGAYELTRWLLTQGCRRILPIWTTSPELYWSRERQAGYEMAMHEAGIEPMATFVVADITARYGVEERERRLALYSERLKPFFKAGSTPDALLIPSDGVVADFDEICRMYGVIPYEDILICGYDNYWQDLKACGYDSARPAATVDKLNEEVGAEMVRLLLDRAEGLLDHESGGRAIVRVVEPRLNITSPQDELNV